MKITSDLLGKRVLLRNKKSRPLLIGESRIDPNNNPILESWITEISPNGKYFKEGRSTIIWHEVTKTEVLEVLPEPEPAKFSMRLRGV